ncbi:hypothetical protein, partial [Pseudomonas aeruginosa]|uniref:hypothetical protein n=1 Tax=Pseudomonas aeruginosa TaxID=287 RepID=UPI001C3FB25B
MTRAVRKAIAGPALRALRRRPIPRTRPIRKTLVVMAVELVVAMVAVQAVAVMAEPAAVTAA